MGVFKKFLNVVRSNLNSLLDQAEDPKKMADLALVELSESKKKAHRLLTSSLAEIKMAEKQAQKAQEDIRELEEAAERELKNNNEVGAREKLEQKQQLTSTLNLLRKEISQGQEEVQTINRGLVAIDKKIEEIKGLKKTKFSRPQKNEQDFGPKIERDHLADTEAFDTFARMEEKIESAEFEIEALNELFQEKEAESTKAETIDHKFDKSSDPKELESELNALRKKLSGD